MSLEALQNRIDSVSRPRETGRVTRLIGPLAQTSLTGLKIGDTVSLVSSGEDEVIAEVVGFQDGESLLALYGSAIGIGVTTKVVPHGAAFQVTVGDCLLGRVLDATGQPLDQRGPLHGGGKRSVRGSVLNPMDRTLIEQPLITGIRAIDGLMTLGVGQRVALIGPPGSGKSTLVAQIARNTQADVCVLTLIGERGREVREFLERTLPPEHRDRIVTVVSTSDDPAGLRLIGARTALAIAEYFRDSGKNVLLLFDSVTRLARALRDLGLTMGLPPIRRGFTPNVFSELPLIFERIGGTNTGSITGIFTVLSEAEIEDDPIAEEVQSLLDGHIHLDPALAAKGHYPAINVLNSKSRVMNEITAHGHQNCAKQMRQNLSKLQEVEFLRRVGEYSPGNDTETDRAVNMENLTRDFLCQDGSSSDFGQTVSALEGSI